MNADKDSNLLVLESAYHWLCALLRIGHVPLITLQILDGFYIVHCVNTELFYHYGRCHLQNASRPRVISSV